MRLLKLNQITGDEILAKAILTSEYKELLGEGTRVRPEYIPKLIEAGIREVYVKDNELDPQTRLILKADINRLCKEKVQKILSKEAFGSEEDMAEVIKTADNIINVISNDDNVTTQIYDIKVRSANLYEHCINTCAIATVVAIRMKLSWKEIQQLGIGCILHDIGLRYVIVDYIDKDISDMEPTDREEYLKHPIEGFSSIRNEDWLSTISKEIILMHHEDIEGKGYPLHTKRFMITTKIASICDLFDEMICGVGCRRRKTYEAIEYLKTYRGIRYDESVVNVLLDSIAVYPSGEKVLLSTGETAIVVNQNRGFPEKPIVQLVMDPTGVIYDRIEVRNLLDFPSLYIDAVFD